MTHRSKTSALLESAAIGSIFLAGVILRLRQYLMGRSLWMDEAMLALNIVNRNFLDLFKPLDYDQGAPIGFLLIEKIFTLLLGRNEYALRLFPLTLGLLALWVFYLLLKRFTHGTSLVLALALFALNPRLIYYSSEVKQYNADVFVFAALFLAVTDYFERPSQKGLGMLAIAGFFALWLSHPSVFLLAAIGTTLFISALKKQDTTNLRLVAGMGLFWLANVGLLYALTLGNLQSNSYMQAYWQDAFAPIPPWSKWGWYWESFKANADALFAIKYAPLFLLLSLLAGWVFLFKQKRDSAIVLAWMLFFTLLASLLTLYPSLERMVLFLVPAGIFLIGISLGFVIEKLRGRAAVAVVTTSLFSVYLFQGALPLTIEQFASPKYFEHIRPTMEFLQGSWREGDALYVSYGGVPAFEYYAPMYGLENVSYAAGRRDDYGEPDQMSLRLEPLKGRRRVWVLFSHVYEQAGFNEKDFLVEYLAHNGIRKREFREPGTSVYLYLFDLGR